MGVRTRPCKYPQCYNTVDGGGYCEKHNSAKGRNMATPKREDVSFYATQRWRNASVRYRRKHPLCQHCDKEGRTVPAAHVDHITPLEQGGDPFNNDNLQALCIPCHNRKTAEDKATYSTQSNDLLQDNENKCVIVYGAPGAGKTTYVKQHMKEGDLVVDIDAIAEALSFTDPYNKPQTVMPYVHSARLAILRHLERSVETRRAWIVCGGATLSERQRLKSQLKTNAMVLILQSQSTCLRRIKACPYRGKRYEEYAGIVKRWFERYQEEKS